MRKFSTHIGVYAILLIAAFYGSLSVLQQGQTSAGSAVIIQNAITTEEKAQTATPRFYLSSNNSKACYSLSLQAPKIIHATAGTEQNSFTHSARHPYYINTL